jgi:hypothetical protein
VCRREADTVQIRSRVWPDETNGLSQLRTSARKLIPPFERLQGDCDLFKSSAASVHVALCVCPLTLLQEPRVTHEHDNYLASRAYSYCVGRRPFFVQEVVLATDRACQ